MTQLDERASDTNSAALDAIIVGAGFAGLYSIYRLRRDGLSVRAFERGSDVGGTWYWNRYPGARCDIESIFYSFTFSDELQQEWTWNQRYAEQRDIHAYARYVADRFDLRRDIVFNTTVVSAVWDDSLAEWAVTTNDGATTRARHLVMASGCLSEPIMPDLPGVSDFRGRIIHTSRWPDDADLAGKRVAIVGTGSSCIQSAPIIATEAEQLYVIQRTPQYAIPAWNREYSPDEIDETKSQYPQIRKDAWENTIGGVPYEQADHDPLTASPDEVEAWLERTWLRGGYLMIASYPDVLFRDEVNELVGEFVKRKLRERINDTEVAEKLLPTYPFAAKRLCVDTNYFEMYNRDNVTLVDLREHGIDRFDEAGLFLDDGSHLDIDVLIMATGFNAMTGAILAIDIVGRDGVTIREKWSQDISAYFGIAVSGFPNMYTINGPGSVSVLYNMIPAIEHHVDWIADAIAFLDENGYEAIEPTPEAESAWADHVDEVAATTVYPKVSSWYMGTNTPGKVKGFLAYAGGGPAYFEAVERDRQAGYAGFRLTPSKVRASNR